MGLRNSITSQIVFPLSDLLSGQSTYQNFVFLQKSQHWNLKQLESYQNEKLQSLIKHAYLNVPYYTELFDELRIKPNEIQTKNDLKKIPFLTKDIIRENYSKLISKDLKSRKTIMTGSSGSTGEPLHYPIDKFAYSLNLAASIRGWYWMGYKLGDKYVKLSQNPRNSKIKKVQDWLSSNRYMFSQQLVEENFKKLVHNIKAFKPKVLRGYPDPLFFMAKYMKDNGVNDLHIPLITTTGNMLFPEVRAFIEEQFGAQIFDAYSCEGSANFFESNMHGFYYATMEYAISEIINGNNSEVERGESGRHVSTDLHNYAMPFIRYDTQDILVKESDETFQKKDKNLLAIDSIKGRDNDILITPKGKYLIVHNFTGFFQQKELKSVEAFQVRQYKINEIEIFLQVNHNFTDKVKDYIQSYWESYIGDNVQIKLTLIEEIELTKSGKRRFLIRNDDIKLDF
jgi:phenylacetate-CoA ligase